MAKNPGSAIQCRMTTFTQLIDKKKIELPYNWRPPLQAPKQCVDAGRMQSILDARLGQFFFKLAISKLAERSKLPFGPVACLLVLWHYQVLSL